MELNPDNRKEMIKVRVSKEEKILIKAKAEYYGYRKLDKGADKLNWARYTISKFIYGGVKWKISVVF